MAQYSYADTAGNIQTIEAADANTALGSAPNIGTHSGVQLVPPGSTGGTVTAPTGASTAAGVGTQTPSVTSTSGTSRTSEQTLGNNIYNAPPSPDTSYIDNYENTIRGLYDSGNSSINSNYDAQETSLADTQNRETGADSAMLARAGGYLGNSGSGTGVLLNLAATHRAEMGKLEALRQASLQAAKDGYATKSFQIAQERASLAKQYETDSNTAKQKFFDDTQKVLTQNSISTALANGAKTPQAIFDALGGKVDIATIHSFLGDLSTSSTTGGGGFSFSGAELPHVLSTGLSLSDVQNAESYINEHGYTPEFRNLLTPSQRTAFDAVFYPKPTGTQNTSTGVTVKSGNLTYTPEDHAADSNVLENGGTSQVSGKTYTARGNDGYVDPGAYYEIFQNWTDNGGTIPAFLREYPPKDYVNPENTWLPSYLMPSKPSSSSSDVTFTAGSIP